MSSTMPAFPRSCWSTSSEVTYWPDFVFLGLSTSCILPNNTSPTCFGEEILNSSPASSNACFSYCSMRSVNCFWVSFSELVSSLTPLISMSANTFTSGISMSWKSFSPPTSFSFGSSAFFSLKVTSASSAAYSYTSFGLMSRMFFCDLPFGPISSSI